MLLAVPLSARAQTQTHYITLEWTAPSPPPHGNFTVAPVAYRGPYEYSLPGREKDYTMQTEPVQPNERAPHEPTMSLSH